MTSFDRQQARNSFIAVEFPTSAGILASMPKPSWVALSLGDEGGAEELREQIAESTSIMLQIRDPSESDLGLEAVVERQLRALGRSQVDALILAEPHRLDGIDGIARVWSEMQALRDRNLVGQLGIAHAGRPILEALIARCSVPPEINQIELHPYWRDAALVDFCRSRGISCQALHPIGPRLADDGRPALEQDPVLEEIAASKGTSPLRVSMAWCLERADGVLLAREDVAALASGDWEESQLTLSAADVERIDGLHCDWRVDNAPDLLNVRHWDGSASATRVLETDASDLEYGLYKRCYLQVSESENVNRRVSEIIWRYLFNLPATILYRLQREPLSPLAGRLSEEMLANGFAATSLSELGLGHLLDEMQPDLDRAKAEALSEETDPEDDYRHNSPAPLAGQVANCDVMRQVADRYLGMRALRDQLPPAMRVIPARRTPASQQQLWHIDVEDFCVMKTFLLLEDLDADTKGCVEYVKGSHPFGPLADDAATMFKRTWIRDPEPGCTHQVKNEDLLEHVRPDLVQRLGGPKGTVLIFDARGLHRGGHVLEGSRAHAVNSYHSPNPIHPWVLRRSIWNLIWAPLRWQTNLSRNRKYEGWPPSTRDNFKVFGADLWATIMARFGRASN